MYPASSPTTPRSRRFHLLLLIFCLTSIPPVYLFLKARELGHEQELVRFHADADIAATIVTDALTYHLLDIDALQRFLTHADGFSRQSFSAFVTPVLYDRGGVQAYEWIPVVRRAERSRAETAATREHGTSFAIMQRTQDGSLVPAEERAAYYPVYYVEPLQGNEKAVGFDLGSNPARLAALERARDTGQPVATERVRLVQETGAQYGFLIFQPVYDRSKPTETEQERRAAILGFALGVFRFGDMLQNALASLRGKHLAVELADLTASPGNEQLYAGTISAGESRSDSGESPPGDLRAKRSLRFAGRSWEVLIQAKPDYTRMEEHWAYWLILPGGLFASMLITLYIFVIATNRDRALTLAGERAATLRDMDQVLSAISAILIGVNDQGRVVKWNKAASSALGIAEHAAQDQLFTGLTIPWDWEQVLAAMNRCTMERQPVKVSPLPYKRPNACDGSLVLTVCPLLGDNGSHEGFLLQGEDVTDIKLLEAQLAQAQRLESIGQLAAGIAHEINTPIQYISDTMSFLRSAFSDLTHVLDLCHLPAGPVDPGLCTALENTDYDFLKEETPRGFDSVQEGLQRVSTIVQAMRRFSHPGGAEKKPVDINDALESTLVISRNEWKYVAELETELGSPLPMVMGLAGELNQAFLNIVVNAAHAIADVVGGTTARGLIRVSTRRDGEWVEIRIADTGRGIPEETQRHVFDPFFTTKPVGQGTGQGLTIAYDIVVKKHGGSISFETETDRGTTFIVRLPVGDEAERSS